MRHTTPTDVAERSLQPTTIVRRAPNVAACDLGEEVAILHLETGIYFGLNQVGTRIWGLLEHETALEAIVLDLLGEYEVDREVCEQDVAQLLGEMRRVQLIEIKGS